MLVHDKNTEELLKLQAGNDEPPDDGVNHPLHYNVHPSGVECVDVIEHMMCNPSNVIKYVWRAGEKPGESATKDLNKALFYLMREMNRRKIPITTNVDEFVRRSAEYAGQKPE